MRARQHGQTGARGNYRTTTTMSDRNNFATMAQLEKACNDARTILRRRHPTSDQLLHAALELNKAVRSLRSWLGSCNDEVRHARRLAADRLQEIRQLDALDGRHLR
jgi:hypothetical protein